MNREEIIRLVREAKLFYTYEADRDKMEHFAALVAAHEREQCAKVCDNLAIDRGMFDPDQEDFKVGVLGGAAMCAATIRSRK